MVQLGVYGLLFLSMMTLITRGLMTAAEKQSSATLRRVILSSLIFSIAALAVGPDAGRLLSIAVKPRAIFSTPAPIITVKVTPPDYSGREMFTGKLTSTNDAATNLPPIAEGSQIKLHIENTRYAPTLVAGPQKIAFLSAEDGGFTAHFTLKDETIWQIKEGSREIARWPIVIIEDDPPVIITAEIRELTEAGGLLGLSINISDDYGIKDLQLGLIPPMINDPSNIQEIHDQTILAVANIKDFSGELFIDLTSSVFAGQRVDLVLLAQDQAGQESRHVIPSILLPRKPFSDPLARRIIEIRDGIKQQPDRREKYARQLMALGLVPNRGETNSTFYMAVRSAYWRLINPKTAEDIQSALDIMWDLAQSLEDGDGGPFTNKILGHLSALKLALNQQQNSDDIRDRIEEMDREVIIFLRTEHSTYSAHPPDVKALRRIYNQVLKLAHLHEFDKAINLVTYLEHGFIYRDRDMLSGLGYGHFQKIKKARDQVSELEASQREIMAITYRGSITLELASNTDKGISELSQQKNIAKNITKNISGWIMSQKKLGLDIMTLGRNLLKDGIDISGLTVTASDITSDIAHNMEAGDMEAAARDQAQILILLKTVKNKLGQQMRLKSVNR